MSTFDSTKLPLRDVIAGIKKGEYQLPDFQRGWVWDDEHVRSLLVSIARSFPIGAVMTLETGGDVRFQVRPIENVQIPDGAEPEKLILDGQQRLTSLTQVLGLTGPVKTRDQKRHATERYYYIDIKKALASDDLDEAFYSVGNDKKVTSDFGRKVELDLTTLDKEVEALQFPCNQIFNYDDWQDKCYEGGKFKEFQAFRKKVIEPIHNYYVPIIALNRHTSKEAVCLVFEKVNTGGVSLTAFELITATFAADGYNLREDWFGDARKKVEGRVSRLMKEPVLTKLQPTDFIQAVTLLHTYKKNRVARSEGVPETQLPGISCKRKTMLNLELSEFLEWAPKVEKAFLAAAKFLKKECLTSMRELPYRTQLVPLASIMVHLEGRWLEPKIYQRLAEWYWCGVMGELYGSAIENRFANDLEDFLIWMEDESKKPRTIFDASFQPSRLETLRTRNSAAYKGLNVLSLRSGAQDLFWKAGVLELEKMGEPLDIHHIFPKSWCEKNDISAGIYDSAVNKTPISARTNRKIGGDAPSKYIKRIQQDAQVDLTDEAMDQLLESHVIDPGSFRGDDFYQFIQRRSKALLDLIYAAMGKGDSAPEDLVLFGLDSEANKEKELKLRLAADESYMLEFKSTLCWNVDEGRKDKTMEKVILKTIAALSNGKGGTLLIGVDDKKNILGLENDYQVLRKPDNDGFQLHLEQLVDTAFGTDFTASNILVSFPKIDEKFICEVVVSRGTEPLYVEETDKHGKKEKKFYLRSGNSSKAQDVEAAAKYISQRFTS
jgi:hypothetical protein